MKALLEMGAKANDGAKRMVGSATSLQGAAQNGNVDIITALLDKGADINAQGLMDSQNVFSYRRGNAPLHYGNCKWKYRRRNSADQPWS